MALHLQRERGRGVAEPLADDLLEDPCLQRRRGVGVPDVVEPDPREAGGIAVLVEQRGDGVGVQRPSVRPHEQQLGVLTEVLALLVSEADVVEQRVSGVGVESK